MRYKDLIKDAENNLKKVNENVFGHIKYREIDNNNVVELYNYDKKEKDKIILVDIYADSYESINSLSKKLANEKGIDSVTAKKYISNGIAQAERTGCFDPDSVYEAASTKYDEDKKRGSIDFVAVFREKTDKYFRKIEGKSAREVESIALEEIKNILNDNDITDVEIVDLVVAGSRSRGIENENSDIDVVLEFKANAWKEYSLFDVLNDGDNRIEGIILDINPITEGKSGTLESYLPRLDKYLEDRAVKLNRELIQKAEKLGILVDGKIVKTDEKFSKLEMERLVDVLTEEKKNNELEKRTDKSINDVQR